MLTRFVLGSLIIVLMAFPVPAQTQDDIAAYRPGLPFPMPVITIAEFPKHSENIVDHGAVADGHTLVTPAITAAIEACAKAGGGTVIIPPGLWMSGPIRLESNINLHLERGAVLKFSPRFEDFQLVAGYDGKSKKFQLTPPILGYRIDHVAITGEGVIDGSGEAWRPVKKEKQTPGQWKELTASGGAVTPDGRIWWPSAGAVNGEEFLAGLQKSGASATKEQYAQVREYLRPNLVHLVQCTNILLDGPTFRNSPRFHIQPQQSENIIVRNITIQCDWWAQNGDGLDLSACRNVVVTGIMVDAGDDGICIKPGNIAKSQKAGPACENIVIAGCTVYHAHGGFVIGSETNGGARNIAVRNCTFIGTDVGLRFKSLRGRGGLIENIDIDGIRMSAIANEAILFDLTYGGDAPEVEAAKDRSTMTPEPVSEHTPQFRNISMRNIVCVGAKRAMLVEGLPEMPVRAITLEHASISARRGVIVMDADSLTFSDVRLETASGPAFALNQASNIFVRNTTMESTVLPLVELEGNRTANILFEKTNIPEKGEAVHYGNGLKKEVFIRK